MSAFRIQTCVLRPLSPTPPALASAVRIPARDTKRAEAVGTYAFKHAEVLGFGCACLIRYVS